MVSCNETATCSYSLCSSNRKLLPKLKSWSTSLVRIDAKIHYIVLTKYLKKSVNLIFVDTASSYENIRRHVDMRQTYMTHVYNTSVPSGG